MTRSALSQDSARGRPGEARTRLITKYVVDSKEDVHA